MRCIKLSLFSSIYDGESYTVENQRQEIVNLIEFPYLFPTYKNYGHRPASLGLILSHNLSAGSARTCRSDEVEDNDGERRYYKTVSGREA